MYFTNKPPCCVTPVREDKTWTLIQMLFTIEQTRRQPELDRSIFSASLLIISVTQKTAQKKQRRIRGNSNVRSNQQNVTEY